MRQLIRKCLLVCSALIFVFPAACEKKPENPVSEYGDALIGAQERAREAAEIANLTAIQKSIQVYHAAHGRYPESLQDIDDLMRTPIDPEKYLYDPRTGTVRMKNK